MTMIHILKVKIINIKHGLGSGYNFFPERSKISYRNLKKIIYFKSIYFTYVMQNHESLHVRNGGVIKAHIL